MLHKPTSLRGASASAERPLNPPYDINRTDALRQLPALQVYLRS